MNLPHHNRFDYSAIVERPDYSWPDGKRLALHVATNLEHFAFGEGIGHTPTEPGPPPHGGTTGYASAFGAFSIFSMSSNYRPAI